MTPSPHPTPPPSLLFLTVRLPVSHQCSPFFSQAAVTESPALFPVVKARCLDTGEGGVFIAQGAFAKGREVHFLSLTGPKPASTRAQHSATAPRGTQHFTISQLLVVAAEAPCAQGYLHKVRMKLV